MGKNAESLEERLRSNRSTTFLNGISFMLKMWVIEQFRALNIFAGYFYAK